MSARARDPLGWAGATIDARFRVESIVGEGGFGVVYRGMHLGLHEPIAIKCLRLPGHLSEEDRGGFMEDLRGEARTLHRLSRQSAGIVQALDVGAATSPLGMWTPYIVMEWLDGVTLEHDLADRARRRVGGRPLSVAVDLLAPAVQALAVAHAAGVAHLDVKPANLFLTSASGIATMKLLDFGIAKTLTSSDTLSRALTQQNAQLQAFTPSYAAPEQFSKAHGKTGAHTDVFAVALVLIEVAAGTHALDGELPLQLYVSAANAEVRPSLGARGVRTTERVEAVVRRALEVDPVRRFPDAATFWSALTAAVAEVPDEPATRTTRASFVPVSQGALGASSAPTAYMTLAPTGENRVCTVALAELVGTAAMAQRLDPEQLRTVVDRCTQVLARCASEAGGAIQERVGDTIMVVFGLQGDSGNAAERAVHSALQMQRALADLAPPHRALPRPRLRVGIQSGRVFAGMGTTSSGPKTMVTGAPVTAATRLQRAAAPGAVLIGHETYRQVRGQFEVEPTLLPDEEGEAAIKAYRVDRAAAPADVLGLIAGREFLGQQTRFVGRASEIENLGAIASAVAEGRSARLVEIVGAPGIGRSRLLLEALGRLEADGFTVFAASVSALSTRTSYALAARLLRGRFSIHEDDAPEVTADKLRQGVLALHGGARAETRAGAPPVSRPVSPRRFRTFDAEELIEPLLRVLGHGTPKRSSGPTAPPQSEGIKHRISAAFAALLGQVPGPVALVCDDAHWGDEASLELFDDLLVRLAREPLLIACTFQPSTTERRVASGGRRDRIDLGPLPVRHLEEMARDRLKKVEAMPADLVRRLAEHAEGYPLTLVETIHYLVDAGAVDASDPSAWRVAPDRLGELALPTTVQGIVQARLDRFDEGTRALLGNAAVIGMTFWDGAVAALDPSVDRPTLDRALATLCERGFARSRSASTFPNEREYVFAEGAIQKVAYEMLAATTRRALHKAAAAWLAARTGEADAALLARHYDKAGALAAAWEAYARAGAFAASLGQAGEAVQCFERACLIDGWLSGDVDANATAGESLVLADEAEQAPLAPWAERVRVRVELGDVLQRSGHLDAAADAYGDVRRLIERALTDVGEGAPAEEALRWAARVDFHQAGLDHVRGEVDAALERVTQAIERAAAGGLVEERAQMLGLLAILQGRKGDEAGAVRSSREGLRLCRGAARRGERWREAVASLLRNLGVVFYWRGRMVRAERCYLQASRMLDERRDAHELARVLNNVAAVRHGRGDVAGARDSLRHALDLADRSGDLRTTMTALANLGEVEHVLGRHEVARDHLEEAVTLGEQLQVHADLPEGYRNLALARAALGDTSGGLEAAARALELARQAGGRVYLPTVLAAAAEICGRASSAADLVSVARLAAEIRTTLAGLAPSEAHVVETCERLLSSSVSRSA